MFTISQELLNNEILWIAILAWFLAQLIKFTINYFKIKSFDFKLLVSSGGMPSSHSSFVMAITTSIGFKDGFDSSLFALSLVISFIVMYDAMGVRRAAGTQAKVLNKLIAHIGTSGIPIDKKLKELLGHSPIQVFAGALLGIIISTIFML